jgi:hypothetical protein
MLPALGDDRQMRLQRVTALVVSLAVALIFPALALALRRTYFGPVGTGANNAGVEISARIKHGKAVKVTRFEWHNVLGSCNGRAGGASTGELPDAVAVSGGTFSTTQHLNGGRTTVKISGRFKHHRTRMAGSLRVHGTVPGCAQFDTGTLTWHAKQPAGQP